MMICFYKGIFFCIVFAVKYISVFYILRQSPFFLLIFLLLLSPFLFLLPPFFFHFLFVSSSSSLSVDIQQIQWGKTWGMEGMLFIALTN